MTILKAPEVVQLSLSFDNLPIVQLNGGQRCTRIAMNTETKKMHYWLVNREYDAPLNLCGKNQLGVLGEILWSYFEPIDNKLFKTVECIERMTDELSIIIPKKYTISDANVIKFNRIVYNQFIQDIVEIAAIASKFGKSRAKVIETLMKKADLYDLKTLDSIDKQADRYSRNLGRIAYHIFD